MSPQPQNAEISAEKSGEMSLRFSAEISSCGSKFLHLGAVYPFLAFFLKILKTLQHLEYFL